MNDISKLGLSFSQSQVQTPNNVVAFRAQKNTSDNDLYDEYVKKQEKERKSAKRKSNAITALQVGSLLAMIALAGVFIWQAFRGGDRLDFSKIKFEDLKNKALPDLETSKSIDEGVRKRLMEMVKAAKMPEALRKRLGLEVPPNSIILTGGSGVGKTFIAMTYAKKIGAKFAKISYKDIASAYVGQASKNTGLLFEKLMAMAKKDPKQDIVLLIDEADPLLKPLRGIESETTQQIRSSLLTMVDEARKIPNLKIFTATNEKFVNLDSAYVRRLGKNYEIPQPNEEVLYESLKYHLSNAKDALKVGDFDFYRDQDAQIRAFIKNVYDRGGAHGDIELLVKEAKAKCGISEEKTPIKDVKFDVKYLEEALEEKGIMAGEIEREQSGASGDNILGELMNFLAGSLKGEK